MYSYNVYLAMLCILIYYGMWTWLIIAILLGGLSDAGTGTIGTFSAQWYLFN